MTEEIQTYISLRDHLDMVYGEDYTPHDLGRGLYKSVGCGPWTQFVVKVADPHLQTAVAHIVQGGDGNAVLVSGEDLDDEVQFFLGFKMRRSGAVAEPINYQEFLSNLEEYAMGEHNPLAKQAWEISFVPSRIDLHRPGGVYEHGMEIHLCRKVPMKTRTIYYGDEEAHSRAWINDCLGIEVGSIVEGSDVEIGPEYLQYPFSGEDFFKLVDDINKEASYYWERDNTEED